MTQELPKEKLPHLYAESKLDELPTIQALRSARGLEAHPSVLTALGLTPVDLGHLRLAFSGIGDQYQHILDTVSEQISDKKDDIRKRGDESKYVDAVTEVLVSPEVTRGQKVLFNETENDLAALAAGLIFPENLDSDKEDKNLALRERCYLNLIYTLQQSLTPEERGHLQELAKVKKYSPADIADILTTQMYPIFGNLQREERTSLLKLIAEGMSSDLAAMSEAAEKQERFAPFSDLEPGEALAQMADMPIEDEPKEEVTAEEPAALPDWLEEVLNMPTKAEVTDDNDGGEGLPFSTTPPVDIIGTDLTGTDTTLQFEGQAPTASLPAPDSLLDPDDEQQQFHRRSDVLGAEPDPPPPAAEPVVETQPAYEDEREVVIATLEGMMEANRGLEVEEMDKIPVKWITSNDTDVELPDGNKIRLSGGGIVTLINQRGEPVTLSTSPGGVTLRVSSMLYDPWTKSIYAKDKNDRKTYKIQIRDGVFGSIDEQISDRFVTGGDGDIVVAEGRNYYRKDSSETPNLEMQIDSGAVTSADAILGDYYIQAGNPDTLVRYKVDAESEKLVVARSTDIETRLDLALSQKGYSQIPKERMDSASILPMEYLITPDGVLVIKSVLNMSNDMIERKCFKILTSETSRVSEQSNTSWNEILAPQKVRIASVDLANEPDVRLLDTNSKHDNRTAVVLAKGEWELSDIEEVESEDFEEQQVEFSFDWGADLPGENELLARLPEATQVEFRNIKVLWDTGSKEGNYPAFEKTNEFLKATKALPPDVKNTVFALFLLEDGLQDKISSQFRGEYLFDLAVKLRIDSDTLDDETKKIGINYLYGRNGIFRKCVRDAERQILLYKDYPHHYPLLIFAPQEKEQKNIMASALADEFDLSIADPISYSRLVQRTHYSNLVGFEEVKPEFKVNFLRTFGALFSNHPLAVKQIFGDAVGAYELGYAEGPAQVQELFVEQDFGLNATSADGQPIFDADTLLNHPLMVRNNGELDESINWVFGDLMLYELPIEVKQEFVLKLISTIAHKYRGDASQLTNPISGLVYNVRLATRDKIMIESRYHTWKELVDSVSRITEEEKRQAHIDTLRGTYVQPPIDEARLVAIDKSEINKLKERLTQAKAEWGNLPEAAAEELREFERECRINTFGGRDHMDKYFQRYLSTSLSECSFMDIKESGQAMSELFLQRGASAAERVVFQETLKNVKKLNIPQIGAIATTGFRAMGVYKTGVDTRLAIHELMDPQLLGKYVFTLYETEVRQSIQQMIQVLTDWNSNDVYLNNLVNKVATNLASISIEDIVNKKGIDNADLKESLRELFILTAWSNKLDQVEFSDEAYGVEGVVAPNVLTNVFGNIDKISPTTLTNLEQRMVLCGPNGDGKTSTLFAIGAHLSLAMVGIGPLVGKVKIPKLAQGLVQMSYGAGTSQGVSRFTSAINRSRKEMQFLAQTAIWLGDEPKAGTDGKIRGGMQGLDMIAANAAGVKIIVNTHQPEVVELTLRLLGENSPAYITIDGHHNLQKGYLPGLAIDKVRTFISGNDHSIIEIAEQIVQILEGKGTEIPKPAETKEITRNANLHSEFIIDQHTMIHIGYVDGNEWLVSPDEYPYLEREKLAIRVLNKWSTDSDDTLYQRRGESASRYREQYKANAGKTGPEGDLLNDLDKQSIDWLLKKSMILNPMNEIDLGSAKLNVMALRDFDIREHDAARLANISGIANIGTVINRAKEGITMITKFAKEELEAELIRCATETFSRAISIEYRSAKEMFSKLKAKYNLEDLADSNSIKTLYDGMNSEKRYELLKDLAELAEEGIIDDVKLLRQMFSVKGLAKFHDSELQSNNKPELSSVQQKVKELDFAYIWQLYLNSTETFAFAKTFRKVLERLSAEEGVKDLIELQNRAALFYSLATFEERHPDLAIIEPTLSDKYEVSSSGLVNLQIAKAQAKQGSKSVVQAYNIDLENGMALTGPNAGGKTSYVSGLLQAIMRSRALPIAIVPKELASERHILPNRKLITGIYTGVNRAETRDNLSNFESDTLAVITALNEWEKQGYPEGFVIFLDESFEGTNSIEMAALCAALFQIAISRGAKVLMTTNDGKVVEAMNLINEKVQKLKMGPNYNVEKGVGSPDTFRVAREKGMSPTYVDIAEKVYELLQENIS